MFVAGQRIGFEGFMSHRLSVRTLELPPALRQSSAAPTILKKRILVPDLSPFSVRGLRHSAMKENKYSGEYSMTNQREAIWKTMNPEAFKVLTERTTEINDFQVHIMPKDDRSQCISSLISGKPEERRGQGKHHSELVGEVNDVQEGLHREVGALV